MSKPLLALAAIAAALSLSACVTAPPDYSVMAAGCPAMTLRSPMSFRMSGHRLNSSRTGLASPILDHASFGTVSFGALCCGPMMPVAP